MKTFSLLKLFPVGYLSGNQVINEVSYPTKDQAVNIFQKLYPELDLNSNGYAKHGEISYCVAEHYSPFSN